MRPLNEITRKKFFFLYSSLFDCCLSKPLFFYQIRLFYMRNKCRTNSELLDIERSVGKTQLGVFAGAWRSKNVNRSIFVLNGGQKLIASLWNEQWSFIHSPSITEVFMKCLGATISQLHVLGTSNFTVIALALHTVMPTHRFLWSWRMSLFAVSF